MISLEQIRLLENKITKALAHIEQLRGENQKLHDENRSLRGGIDSANKRMKELEAMIEGFKTDQKEIEEIVVRALGTLDELEDGISPAPTPSSVNGASAVQSAAPSTVTAEISEAATAAATAHGVATVATSGIAAIEDAEEPPKTKKGQLDIF
jgi:FtsZ-binding cell division protein ZapB